MWAIQYQCVADISGVQNDDGEYESITIEGDSLEYSEYVEADSYDEAVEAFDALIENELESNLDSELYDQVMEFENNGASLDNWGTYVQDATKIEED